MIYKYKKYITKMKYLRNKYENKNYREINMKNK